MKQKILKITAFLALLILMIGLGLFANGLLGNPVSKMLAKRTAQKHLAENYGDTDFYISQFNYDFKTGSYLAYIKSDSSVDSHFPLYIGMDGRLQRDGYDQVLNGWNTYERLSTAYRELVDTVLENPAFSKSGEIAYGELSFYEKEQTFGLKIEELKVDGLYDVQKIGAEYGYLTIYMEDKILTAERAAEQMLEVKKLMDEGGVPFCMINFVLQSPKPEDGGEWSEERIEVRDFLYKDIYEEGLEERVREADKAAKAYYAEQDAKK